MSVFKTNWLYTVIHTKEQTIASGSGMDEWVAFICLSLAKSLNNVGLWLALDRELSSLNWDSMATC